MPTETHLAEQRDSIRYRVEGNAYALLKQPQYKELGRIVDISHTGISFLCINQGDWDTEPFEIDIFVGHEQNSCLSEHLILKNLPLLPIAYCRDNDQEDKPVSMMRRCGVKFGKLTPEQRAKLALFILQHGFANA